MHLFMNIKSFIRYRNSLKSFCFLTALPQIMPVPKESPPGAANIGHRAEKDDELQ